MERMTSVCREFLVFGFYYKCVKWFGIGNMDIFVFSIKGSEVLKLNAAIPILDESDTATHVRVIRIWRDSHLHELHIFPCWGHTDKIYCHELSWITELWDQMFPQWCCWGPSSSRMWACVAELMLTDISKEHHPQPLKMKVLLSFETLSNTNPAVQYNVPEDLDSYT